MYIEFSLKSLDRCGTYILIPFVRIFSLLTQIKSKIFIYLAFNFYFKVIRKSMIHLWITAVFVFFSFMLLLNLQIVVLRNLYSYICIRKNALGM